MCVRLLHLKWNIKHFIIRYARFYTIFKLKLHYSLITYLTYTHTQKPKSELGFYGIKVQYSIKLIKNYIILSVII